MRPGPLILRFGQWRIERIKTGLVRRTKVGCHLKLDIREPDEIEVEKIASYYGVRVCVCGVFGRAVFQSRVQPAAASRLQDARGRGAHSPRVAPQRGHDPA